MEGEILGLGGGELEMLGCEHGHLQGQTPQCLTS